MFALVPAGKRWAHSSPGNGSVEKKEKVKASEIERIYRKGSSPASRGKGAWVKTS